MFAQEGDDVLAAEGGGEIDRGGAALVAQRIGAGVQQHPRDVHVPLEGHPAKRRLALFIPEVHLCAGLEQHRHGLGPPLVGGDHEERVALGIAQVDVESLLQGRSEGDGLALAGELRGGFGQQGGGAHALR